MARKIQALILMLSVVCRVVFWWAQVKAEHQRLEERDMQLTDREAAVEKLEAEQQRLVRVHLPNMLTCYF